MRSLAPAQAPHVPGPSPAQARPGHRLLAARDVGMLRAGGSQLANNINKGSNAHGLRITAPPVFGNSCAVALTKTSTFQAKRAPAARLPLGRAGVTGPMLQTAPASARDSTVLTPCWSPATTSCSADPSGPSPPSLQMKRSRQRGSPHPPNCCTLVLKQKCSTFGPHNGENVRILKFQSWTQI